MGRQEDGNGWLLSYGWDDPAGRPGSYESEYMRGRVTGLFRQPLGDT